MVYVISDKSNENHQGLQKHEKKLKNKAFPKCVSLLEITPERLVPSFLRILIITIG